MEAQKIMDNLQNGVKTLSAALAAGEITGADSIGFNIGADGEVTLTKGGQVLAICANATDADAAKRWLDALTTDIEAKRAEEAEAIRKAAKSARKALAKKQKELADAQKKAEAVAEAEADAEEDEDEEDDALDEDGDAKKPVAKKPAPKPHDYKKDVERLTSDVEKAQEKVEKTSAALKRLEDEGKVDEKTESALAAARIMADQIGGYIEQAAHEPAFAEAAKREWKTLPRLIKYLFDKAQKLVLKGGSAACCVPDAEVFSWIHEYMLLDDEEKCRKEDEEAKKAAKEKAYCDAKSKADGVKRDATALRKRANEAKKKAEEESDPVKKAALMAEYEQKNAEADKKLEKSKEMYAALPENPNPDKDKKGKEKKGTAKTSAKPAAKASAKPKKEVKAPEVKEEEPPLQMTLFDLLGVA